MGQVLSLPRIRQDLNLYPAPSLRDGSPSWTIHDPLRNRYFRIGWQEFEMLSRFGASSLEQISTELRRVGVEGKIEERLSTLVRFLKQNQLVETDLVDRESNTVKRKRWSSPFFIKIPLFYPDRLLQLIYPMVSWLFQPMVGVLTVLAGLLSLLMVVQQQNLFFATFTELQSPLGVALLLLAILFSKAVHEMGHALVAKHYGLHVPTFGVAFLFFWPVFYTDGSDGWKLQSRRARLMIGGGGVVAETILAIVATLSWIWLDDGLLRSVAFTLAVTTWGMTLLVNLNPLMRFDGYFLLSDWWEEPNLQSRSFALGRAKLRALLMGVPSPLATTEEDKSRKRRLIGYAWLTWVYRLSLYMGLALLAYHFLYKALGILLLIAEMSVLVVKPIMVELRQYWSLREQFRWVRSNRIAVLLLVGGAISLIVPWKSSVEAPAIWEAGNSFEVYAGEGMKVEQLHVTHGDWVAAETLLAETVMPELIYEQSMVKEQIEEQRQIVRSGQMARDNRDTVKIEQRKLDRLHSKMEEIEGRLQRAKVRAPVSGKIVEVAPTLEEGVWVLKGERLFTISDEKRATVRGWFHERDILKLKQGASGRFFPEFGGGVSVPVQLEKVAISGDAFLDEPLLSSINRGTLPVRVDAEQRHALQESYYQAEFSVERLSAANVGVLRGRVVVDADPSSQLYQGWQWLESIMIRESGF